MKSSNKRFKLAVFITLSSIIIINMFSSCNYSELFAPSVKVEVTNVYWEIPE